MYLGQPPIVKVKNGIALVIAGQSMATLEH
jgi:hypothetical protein